VITAFGTNCTGKQQNGCEVQYPCTWLKVSGESPQLSAIFIHIADCSPFLPNLATRGWKSTPSNKAAQILWRASEKRARLGTLRGDAGVCKEAGQECCQCPFAEDG